MCEFLPLFLRFHHHIHIPIALHPSARLSTSSRKCTKWIEKALERSTRTFCANFVCFFFPSAEGEKSFQGKISTHTHVLASREAYGLDDDAGRFFPEGGEEKVGGKCVYDLVF